MSETPKPVRTLVGWLSLALGVAGLGAGAVIYLNQYASAAELRELSQKQDRHHEEFKQHVSEENAKQSAMKQALDDIHDDWHYVRDQLNELARGTHRVISPPAHEEKK